MNKGIFNISLDFELHWGRFDKIALDQQQRSCLANTRKLVPEMLALFVQHDVHVTWATVGMLFNHHFEEWKRNRPASLPVFANESRSAYYWFEHYSLQDTDSEFLFAPSLVERIKETAGQELGTHTYAHYNCLEPGASAETFRDDIVKAKELAAKAGVQLRSLVFPRNQYDDVHLRICAEEGICSVRTNPPDWFWTPRYNENLPRKIFRTIDSLMPAGRNKAYSLRALATSAHQLPVQLPASRLFKPWNPKYPFLNNRKLNRIMNEMTDAAKKGGYYHLWWHPENFGHHPAQCLEELKTILEHYSRLNKEYGFSSLTMQETVETLRNY